MAILDIDGLTARYRAVFMPPGMKKMFVTSSGIQEIRDRSVVMVLTETRPQHFVLWQVRTALERASDPIERLACWPFPIMREALGNPILKADVDFLIANFPSALMELKGMRFDLTDYTLLRMVFSGLNQRGSLA